MLRPSSLLPVACLALALTGCASTTKFTSVWKAPDAQPLTFKPGDKVIALVLAKAPSIRRAGEANLADELTKRGMVGVPAYSLIQDSDVGDEAKAKRAIDASGAVGVIAMRPLGSEKSLSAYSYHSSPYYGGFYGGYYRYGWADPWGSSTTVRTDTYVKIETLIYDLRQNKLVWAGQTSTMNPNNVESMVTELAAAVSHELQASGLVPKKN